MVLGHPAAGGELADDGLVEFAAGRGVDRLDARLRELEIGVVKGPDEAAVFPGRPLGLDEQREAVVLDVFVRPYALATRPAPGVDSGIARQLTFTGCGTGTLYP